MNKLIEGTDVYDYFSCPYKVYNRHNRDKRLMLPLSDFSRTLMESGIEHERKIAEFMNAVEPKYPKFDFEKGAAETKKLMAQGASVIYHGLLSYDGLLGIPDLLIRQPGKSDFGNYAYVASDIKSSIKSKESQIMQVLLYDRILEKIQGDSTGKGMLVLKTTSETINISDYRNDFENALKKISEIINGLDFGLHLDSTCKECPWRDVCFRIAKDRNDISLIYGLPRPVHYRMNELKIFTLAEIETAKDALLSEIDGVGEASVKKWKKQADVLITKKDRIEKIELPDTENHICLDIETSEDGKTYLIGLWHSGKFVSFFSDDEEKNVVDFIQYLDAFKDYRLYHYGNIEKLTFRNLFTKYSIPEEKSQEILGKMIDLFNTVRKNAVLPVVYYGLKDVAKHFGFKWRASDASGSNSMTWYDSWNRTKDEKIKQKILDYNEDDVHATFIILQKLSKKELN